MTQFLVVYDRDNANMIDFQEFGDRSDALNARGVAEREYRDSGRVIEVVVLGASTREQLESTHSRYFSAGTASTTSNRLISAVESS